VCCEAYFKALFHRRVCGVPHAVKQIDTPSPSMGFGPLQGVLPELRCVAEARAAEAARRCTAETVWQ